MVSWYNAGMDKKTIILVALAIFQPIQGEKLVAKSKVPAAYHAELVVYKGLYSLMSE